jgi:hypothetical protein
MALAAILSLATLAASVALPCDLATPADVAALIGGPAVVVPSDEMGEETAPGCMWSTRHREREVKLTVWSKDELPVLGLPDARSYYDKQLVDARGFGPVEEIPSLGDRAFVTGFAAKPGAKSTGLIVVLKDERLFVFDFSATTVGTERAFVAKLMK